MLCNLVPKCDPGQIRALLICEESQTPDVIGAKLVVAVGTVEFRQVAQLAKNGGTVQQSFLLVTANFLHEWALVAHSEEEVQPQLEAAIATTYEHKKDGCQQRHKGAQQDGVRMKLNRHDPDPRFGHNS